MHTTIFQTATSAMANFTLIENHFFPTHFIFLEKYRFEVKYQRSYLAMAR